jgi:hypothetical protein
MTDIRPEADTQLAESMPSKDELLQLIHGIEEACKHARSVLFVLTTTSAFILIAALSETPTGTIKLPVAGNDISRDQFFAWSPLVVLTIYLYLQVYIQEIIVRLDRLHAFEQSAVALKTRLGDLLFPWIFIIGLEDRRRRQHATSLSSLASDDQLGRQARQDRIPMPGLYALAAFIVWILGPLVLAILLVVFLRAERAVAILPCGAFLAASWMALRFLRQQRSRLESALWGVAGSLLIVVTLASVPKLREETYLLKLWNLRHPLASFATREVFPTIGRFLPFVLAAGAAVALIRGLYSRLLPTLAYRRRIQRDLNDASLKENFVSLRATLRSEPENEVDAERAVSLLHSALIVGPAGSGKTTLLKRLGLDTLTLNARTLPVFLRLYQVGNDPLGILGAVAQTLGDYGVRNSIKFLYRQARSGNVTFLLDGMDEVVEGDRKKLMNQLRKLIEEFPKCHIYITGRSDDYERELGTIVEDVVLLLPLREKDVKEFLRQRFGSHAARVEGELSSISNPEMVKNPLLLRLASDSIDQASAIPTSESALLEQMVDLRLRDWDRARHIESNFTFEQKLTFLKRVAQVMQDERVALLTWKEALEVARDVLSELSGSHDAEALISETLRSGLLRRDEAERVGFTHRSIQDHFLRSGARQ